MKIIKFVLTIALSFALTTNAMADDSTETLKQESAGNVTYISGGVGEGDTATMRGIAKDYMLEVVFVEKLKQLEEFVADVKFQIQDARKNVVLELMTEGPFLLANLPQGKYLLTAEYNEEIKQQWVTVNPKKHQKIVFWWPMQELPELE